MIDLMDELKRRDVIARRLALAFTICCATTTVAAGEFESQSAQAASMSRLLAQGWSSPTTPLTLEAGSAANLHAGASLGASVMHWQQDDDLAPSILCESHVSENALVATEQPAPSDSLADLITRGSDPRSTQHQGLRPLHPETDGELLVLPSVSSPSESKSEMLVEDEVADTTQELANPESLADFLRAHRDIVLKSISKTSGTPIEQNTELCDQDDFVAPTRRPLPTGVDSPSNLASKQLRVRSATEISTEPTTEREPDPAGADTTGLNASLRSNVHQSDPKMRTRSNVPSFVSVPPRIVRAPEEPLPASHGQQGSGALELQTESSVHASSDSTEAKFASLAGSPPVTVLPTPVRDVTVEVESAATQVEADATNRFASHPNLAIESVADQMHSQPPAPLRDPVEPSVTLEILEDDGYRRDAEGEYALLPIPSLEGGQSYAPPVPLPPPTPSVTLHTTRLLELAQHSVHRSQRSLQRGATHTARKYAIEAMQAIVALRDAQEGGNLHSQQLERAFDAIRESNDFCGEFGSIDSDALGRMVIVHETTVLKEQDLEVITALEATEGYLDFAKDQLALAVGGIREGSQALLLLGQIELQLRNLPTPIRLPWQSPCSELPSRPTPISRSATEF